MPGNKAPRRFSCALHLIQFDLLIFLLALLKNKLSVLEQIECNCKLFILDLLAVDSCAAALDSSVCFGS